MEDHHSKESRKGPPKNPGLRSLVSNKRRYSSTINTIHARQGFRGWHERGYLPHRDEPGLTQFVTFRLTDCFPRKLRGEWEHLWKIEENDHRRAELERYLDRSHGECQLRQPRIAELVENALRFFHGERYDLRAWVIMPNHVHVLFQIGTTPMSDIVASWKKHTARKANRWLKKRGRFWELDYWDTYMRDMEHEQATLHYIEANPVKAMLIRESQQWKWSSARWRDKWGVLRL